MALGLGGGYVALRSDVEVLKVEVRGINKNIAEIAGMVRAELGAHSNYSPPAETRTRSTP